jgi:uncharacterized protein (TIGR00730 family)
MQIRAIAVFCGSKSGSNPLYTTHAAELGHWMAARGIRLIYGGGGKGLMGTVADAMIEKGGKVTGVIPEVLVKWEAQHEGITELIVVDTMHTRKRKLYELCDAAVVLPGGFGTLDEMYEMLTWNQLSIHDKTIYVMNSAGFYDHLNQHMLQLEKEGFLYEPLYKRIKMVNSPAELEALLKG